MDALSIIKEYGLSVRQIPEMTVSRYEMRHFKEGDEIINVKGKDYCLRYRKPLNPGYWMCKQVQTTDSTVNWNIKTDNLAPSLELSVKLFIEGLS